MKNNETSLNNCDCNINLQGNTNSESMEQMRLELQETRFAIEELALYLDTHPEDTRAICMHNELAKKYRKIMDEYQKVYGSLSILYPCNSWRWLEEPWPWQTRSEIDRNNRSQEVEQSDSCDFDLKGGI